MNLFKCYKCTQLMFSLRYSIGFFFVYFVRSCTGIVLGFVFVKYDHNSYIWKLIVFTVVEEENICMAGLNCEADYATAYANKDTCQYINIIRDTVY